jgi:hypothetical protein
MTSLGVVVSSKATPSNRLASGVAVPVLADAGLGEGDNEDEKEKEEVEERGEEEERSEE